MPRGVYNHKNNKGFTGKKHSKLAKWFIGEGNRRAHAARRVRENTWK